MTTTTGYSGAVEGKHTQPCMFADVLTLCPAGTFDARDSHLDKQIQLCFLWRVCLGGGGGRRGAGGAGGWGVQLLEVCRVVACCMLQIRSIEYMCKNKKHTHRHTHTHTLSDTLDPWHMRLRREAAEDLECPHDSTAAVPDTCTKL